jgi:hypothetical protein
LAGAAHAFPQAPQCAAEVFVSTHEPSHAAGASAGQLATQPDGPQSDAAPPHAVVQLPHVAGRARSASQPLSPRPSQSARPAWQVPAAHLPAWQRSMSANGTEHRSHVASPQPKAGSSTSTQLPAQSFWPARHRASELVDASSAGAPAPPCAVERPLRSVHAAAATIEAHAIARANVDERNATMHLPA